jgi:hypothetical protein
MMGKGIFLNFVLETGEFMKQQHWLVNSENRLLGLLRLNFPIKSQ